jgi:hypothetical protein
MKSIIKFAVGAAIAGALVNMLVKQQRSGRGMSGSRQGSHEGSRQGSAQGHGSGQGMSGAEWLKETPGQQPAGSQSGGGFTVGELVADTNTINSGDPGQDQRGRQPQDWRGAQNVQDS